MDAIIFEVPGDPVPQPRARATRQGRMYTPDKNGIGAYKAAIALVARSAAARAGWDRSEDPHEIQLELIFARPPSHMSRAGELRPAAPRFPGHRSGDNDNLEKGVWDAITRSQSVWVDDRQIVVNSASKRYAAPGENARTVVMIRRLPS